MGSYKSNYSLLVSLSIRVGCVENLIRFKALWEITDRISKRPGFRDGNVVFNYRVYVCMGSIMGVYIGMGSITGVWLKAVGAFLGPNRGCREVAGNGGLHARPLAFQSFIWPKHCRTNKPYLLWTEVCYFKFTCCIIHIKLYYKDRSIAPIIVCKCKNLLSMQDDEWKTNTRTFPNQWPG